MNSYQAEITGAGPTAMRIDFDFFEHVRSELGPFRKIQINCTSAQNQEW